MKTYIQIALLIFLYSCSTVTKNRINEKFYDINMQSYNNYDQDILFSYRERLNHLDPIDSTNYISYLANGVNYIEIKESNIIFVSKAAFYRNSNLKGNKPLYVVGYYLKEHIKHYIVVELYTGNNSTVYVLNETKGKIKSSFLVNNTFETNVDLLKTKTDIISDSVYQINIAYKSYQNKSELSYYQVKISNDGFIIPLSKPVKGE